MIFFKKYNTLTYLILIGIISFGFPTWSLNIPIGSGGPPPILSDDQNDGPEEDPEDVEKQKKCEALAQTNQFQTYLLPKEVIEYCMGKGFDPPRYDARTNKGWRYPEGGIKSDGMSSAFSSKCPPRPAPCKGFAAASGSVDVALPPMLPGAANPSLHLPTIPIGRGGNIPLPCGGTMPLDVSRIMQQGSNFINGVRLGNVQQAVNSGMQIASNFLSGCNGGVINMIQNAINVVVPAGSNVNISAGNASLIAGAVMVLPAGVTININPGSSGVFPDGGSFIDATGAMIRIPGNIAIHVSGAAPNLTVSFGGNTYTAGSTSGSLEITPGNGSGGTFQIPDGTAIPVDANGSVVPASPTGTDPTTAPPAPTTAPLIPDN